LHAGVVSGDGCERFSGFARSAGSISDESGRCRLCQIKTGQSQQYRLIEKE
jgi:hypothetical protein